MTSELRIIISFLILPMCGCVWLRYSEQMLTLQRASQSGEEITQYLNEQEKLFYILKDDIAHDRLETGVSEEDVVSTYGKPVLSKNADPHQGSIKILLYRHPTKFFSSDRIYLYFDQSNSLTHWEHKP